MVRRKSWGLTLAVVIQTVRGRATGFELSTARSEEPHQQSYP